MLGLSLCAALSVTVVDQLQSSNVDNEKIYTATQDPNLKYGLVYVQNNAQDVSGNVICKIENFQRYEDPNVGGYLIAPKSSQVPRDGSVSAYVYKLQDAGNQILQTSSFNDGIIIHDGGKDHPNAAWYTSQILHANQAAYYFIEHPGNTPVCSGPATIPK
jgi:hypothetical protein